MTLIELCRHHINSLLKPLLEITRLKDLVDSYFFNSVNTIGDVSGI